MKQKLKPKIKRWKIERKPENLFNERTSHRLVPLTVPSSSDTVIGSWA